MSTSIGIVGCGAIGKKLLEESNTGRFRVDLSGVNSRSETKARSFLSNLDNPPPYLGLAELISRSDMIVEAAGGEVVSDLASACFASGKNLMVISVGALLESPNIIEQARLSGNHLFIPSGAIAGLDGIKSACRGEINHVTMASRKPPEALKGAPYLIENSISLANITTEKLLFDGSAREACKGFPANINVSAAVSLAGIGPDSTRVQIIATPGLNRNCHDVEVDGEFGKLNIHIENIPSENPKTGRLTSLSIIRSIEDSMDMFHVGT